MEHLSFDIPQSFRVLDLPLGKLLEIFRNAAAAELPIIQPVILVGLAPCLEMFLNHETWCLKHQEWWVTSIQLWLNQGEWCLNLHHGASHRLTVDQQDRWYKPGPNGWFVVVLTTTNHAIYRIDPHRNISPRSCYFWARNLEHVCREVLHKFLCCLAAGDPHVRSCAIHVLGSCMLLSQAVSKSFCAIIFVRSWPSTHISLLNLVACTWQLSGAVSFFLGKMSHSFPIFFCLGQFHEASELVNKWLPLSCTQQISTSYNHQLTNVYYKCQVSIR